MADFRGIWFTDPQNGWIVGGNHNIPGGLIGRTRDGGRTWRFASDLAETPVGRLQVTAVRLFETQRGLVATGDGAIFTTRDGGENWALVRHGSGSEFLNGFSFIDDERGWAVGHGGVLGTTDAGQHWSRLTPSRGGRISGWAIHRLDERTGWLAGMHGTLMHTVDGGVTWESAATPLPAAERPTLRDVFFIDDQRGWVVGEEGTILATRDGGSTWVRRDTGVADARSAPKLERIPRAGKVDVIDAGDRTPGLTLSAVRFVDRSRGWAAGYYAGLGRSLILRTHDGGATWAVDADIAEELRPVQCPFDASQISFVQHRPCPFEAARGGVGKGPEDFRKKTQGGPVLAEQITKALFQPKARVIAPSARLLEEQSPGLRSN